MSRRPIEERRTDDMQDKVSRAVTDMSSAALPPEDVTVSQDETAHPEDPKAVECIETTVELDRVAIYLKGPTAFTA